MATSVDPRTAADLVHGPGETALLDVREAGQFGEGHALFAVPAPYSRLELMAPGLIPLATTRTMLIDGGDGVADKAARRLAAMGYRNVSIVAGGMPAWSRAGLGVFKGVNVPSKLLGELVEHAMHPRTITPQTLAQWRRDGRPFRLFDARPPVEYAKMRVPGAVCLPNGELAHRFAALPANDAPLVVTCAGRTRGLIGVAGLALAGIGGEIYALENGTQGWTLAGYELERGNTPAPFPALDHAARADSAQRAAALARARAIALVDAATVRTWLADETRTTYLFDVRSAPEAVADPIPAATHALGGQLVQATDQWIGVRRARVVLVCDTGLRAGLAAFWLRQQGFETAMAIADDDLRRIPARPLPAPAPMPRPISPDACHRLVSSDGALLLDLSASRTYRQAHASGALWSIRPRLPDAAGRTVCLMADEPAVAALAAIDCLEQGATAVRAVEGGFKAWRTACLPSTSTPDAPSDAEAIDYLLFVHDRHDGNLEACRQYLAWEQGLIAQLSAQERAQFPL